MMERFQELKERQANLEKRLEEQRQQLEQQRVSSSNVSSTSGKETGKVIQSPATSSTSTSFSGIKYYQKI